MKLELAVGKSYLTKQGKKVTITEFDPQRAQKSIAPYKGVYEDGGKDRWFEDGLCGYRDGTWTDIVSEIKQ